MTYGHTGYAGLAGVTLVDFTTGERFSSGKKQLFPGDRLDLDFSGGQPHSLKYEDEDLFLSISFDGEVRRILVFLEPEEEELLLSEVFPTEMSTPLPPSAQTPEALM